jgi:hypothetical protein
MILRELFYPTQENPEEPVEDFSYNPDFDSSPVKPTDTRKTRLTLQQINRIRKASEFRNKTKAEELVSVRQMYSKPTAEEGI